MYFNAEPLRAMYNAQYTITEKYGMQYNLIDCKGRDLLEYTVNYYAVVNPLDYLRFIQKKYKGKSGINISLKNAVKEAIDLIELKT